MIQLTEIVMNKEFKKVYSIKELNKWILYGVRNGYINKDKKDEIIKWVKLLNDKIIQL
jgi:hypothetical protein